MQEETIQLLDLNFVNIGQLQLRWASETQFTGIALNTPTIYSECATLKVNLTLPVNEWISTHHWTKAKTFVCEAKAKTTVRVILTFLFKQYFDIL